MTESPSDAKALFVAVDVHYLDDAGARAAMVAVRDRRFSLVAWTKTAMVPAGAPYQSGEFYLRELPPLRAVIPASDELALIVVDGYVDLDPGGRPGLGAHLHAEFGVPVIGVAKTAFRTATHAAQVFRGQSSRPLHVTAAGMTIADAARLVGEMAGQFRVPDALKLADRLARGLELPDVGCQGAQRHTQVLAGRNLGHGSGAEERRAEACGVPADDGGRWWSGRSSPAAGLAAEEDTFNSHRRRRRLGTRV